MIRFNMGIRAKYNEARVAEATEGMGDCDPTLKEHMVARLNKPTWYTLVVEAENEFNARIEALKHMLGPCGYLKEELSIVDCFQATGEPKVLSSDSRPMES